MIRVYYFRIVFLSIGLLSCFNNWAQNNAESIDKALDLDYKLVKQTDSLLVFKANEVVKVVISYLDSSDLDYQYKNEKTFIAFKGNLIYASYGQYGVNYDYTWLFECWIKNNEVIDLISLGHGPTEEERFEENYLIKEWKCLKNKLD